MLVQYDNGPDELYIVRASVLAVRGEPVDVPDDVAGSEPGEWAALDTGRGPTWDDGKSYRQTETGWETRDPGSGLLAQDDVWHRATGQEG